MQGGDTCALGLIVLVDPLVTSDRLILGHTFLNSYNVNFDFDEGKIGFQGFTSEARENPEEVHHMKIIILVIILVAGGLLIAGFIGLFIGILSYRQSGLSELNEEESTTARQEPLV